MHALAYLLLKTALCNTLSINISISDTQVNSSINQQNTDHYGKQFLHFILI